MTFGVKGTDRTEGGQGRIVPAITTETVIALVLLAALFGVFAVRMGIAFTFKTMMATAHDLLLNKERELTSVAIATHFVGGLTAGVFAHGLFLLLG